MGTERDNIKRLSKSFLDALEFASEAPQSRISVVSSEVKSLIQFDGEQEDNVVRDKFVLACAALASSISSPCDFLSTIPRNLALEAGAAVKKLFTPIPEVMRRVILLLKDKITETSIKGDEITAACARAPVEFAILAANQFRWLVTEINGEVVGTLIPSIVPCGLTAMDHWSPEVKQQAMIAFIHLTKNVSAPSFHFYEDALLDACCKNVVAADEIWESAVEASVSLSTLAQHSHPRSHWYDRLMTEMIGHLERQPGNKDRRVAWLKLIDPMMEKMGLVLLSHFKRLFSLFFVWIHADDAETVLLSLQRIRTAIRVTWMSNASYVARLVDELALLYNKASEHQEIIREEISSLICLLHQCKKPSFEKVWLEKRASFGLSLAL